MRGRRSSLASLRETQIPQFKDTLGWISYRRDDYVNAVSLLEKAVTVSTTVDAPPGSGLGSSSALVVALVEAFRAYLDLPLGRYDVARLAYDIERKDLGLAGGKQDQYAATFGGINFIEFLPDDRTVVNPLRLNQNVLNEFEASLVVCFTGVSRGSDKIIREQTVGLKKSSAVTLKALHQLKADAMSMKRTMLAGDMRSMAEILARSWTAKKRTAGAVTTPLIDELYELALASGALGGKVSGAGGGGFMMFMVAPEDRLQVINALNGSGAMASPVHLTPQGSETWLAPVPLSAAGFQEGFRCRSGNAGPPSLARSRGRVSSPRGDPLRRTGHALGRSHRAHAEAASPGCRPALPRNSARRDRPSGISSASPCSRASRARKLLSSLSILRR